MFCDELGGPLHPSRFTRRFQSAARRARVPQIRLHDLRHTWATLALTAGVHPKVVSERLGHATTSITLDESHGAPVSSAGPAFAGVVKTTNDFFDAYLKADADALDRLEVDGNSRTTRVVFASKSGTKVTLPTVPTQPARKLEAPVSPDTNLTDGQTVTVSWKGFTPGKTINIVQCSNRTAGDASACDLKTGKILQPDPIGSGSLPMEIVTGPVGTGVCDSTSSDCQIVFNDGGSLDPTASVRVSISFAP